MRILGTAEFAKPRGGHRPQTYLLSVLRWNPDLISLPVVLNSERYKAIMHTICKPARGCPTWRMKCPSVKKLMETMNSNLTRGFAASTTWEVCMYFLGWPCCSCFAVFPLLSRLLTNHMNRPPSVQQNSCSSVILP
jgi:hypothetical protein